MKEATETHKQESWQPPQEWGSSSSNWYWEGATSSQPGHDWTWGSWWTAASSSQDWWPNWTEASASASRQMQGRASFQPLKDYRGKEIFNFWGDGRKR